MKKIDCHMHLVENIHGMGSKGYLRDLGDGTGQYENGDIARIIPIEYGNKVTPKTLIDLMDKNDVEAGIILQGHYAGCQNLYAYEAHEEYENRLIPSGMYDPFYRKSDEIRGYLFDTLGFKIIKMEMSNTSGLMCNHPTINLNGTMMHEVYKYANEHKLIFFMDIGRPGNDCYQVENLRKAILKYPKMTFIICHLTAPQKNMQDLLKENMQLLNLPNCYFDIASLYNNVKDPYPFLETQLNLRMAIDIVGKDKILWGSDFPSACNSYPYEKSYQYIEESMMLSKEEKEAILYFNAKKVFGELL